MKEPRNTRETKQAVSPDASEGTEVSPGAATVEDAAGDQTGASASTGESAAEPIKEYILTVNAASGDILRIEKLEPSGRTELSADEYATIFTATGYGNATAETASGALDPYYAGYAQAALDYQSALAAQAQEQETASAQATADYHAAEGQRAFQANMDAAYTQGMTDYQSAVDTANAQSAYTASLEAAYSQGLTDYQTACSQAASAEANASAAYYQGMQDCHAAITQAAAAPPALTPVEAAYYQGVADYRASLEQQGVGTTTAA